MTDNNWTPPESLAERLKRYFVPPSWYIRYLYQKNIRRGERELLIVSALCQKGKISVDVGANKGVYSWALLGYSSEVIAFEPNPKLFRILASWGREKIRVYEKACGRENGSAEMRLPKSSHGYSNQGGSINPKAHQGLDTQGFKVEVIKIDDAIKEDVGFIKIDVEGFELDVLKGAEQLIERCRPNLLIEIEERHTGKCLGDMIKEVLDYGYECLVLLPQGLRPLKDLAMLEGLNINNFIFIPKN